MKMKTTSLLPVLILSFISLFSSAQDKNYPVTTVTLDRNTFDFGAVKLNSEALAEFVIKNTGDNPLVIQEIFMSSHVTVISKPKENLDPGKSGIITLRYDTSKLGPIVKTITIKVNTLEKILPINLKGKVVE